MIDRSVAPALMVLLMLVTGSIARAECPDNRCTTIVLHAMPSFGGCAETGGMDCENTLPTFDLASAGIDAPSIYVYLRNYTTVTGMQCAFEWPASWVLTFGQWSCQSNQINGLVPRGSGPTDGTITTAFDAISDGELALVGAINYAAAPDGCLRIIESSFPFGTHVVDTGSSPAETSVDVDQRGVVCAGTGGIDTCEIPFRPVEPSSWGRIKQYYQ